MIIGIGRKVINCKDNSGELELFSTFFFFLFSKEKAPLVLNRRRDAFSSAIVLEGNSGAYNIRVERGTEIVKSN